MKITILIVILKLLLAASAYAGRPCGSCFSKSYYVKPAVIVPPATVNQTNTYHTYYFKYDGLPYAAQGQTSYLAQGSQQAVLQARLQIDGGERLAQQGFQSYNAGVQANAAISSQLIAANSEERKLILIRDILAAASAPQFAGAGGQPNQQPQQPGQYAAPQQQASRIQTLFRLKQGTMPPAGEPQLTEAEHLLACDAFSELLLGELKAAGGRFRGANDNQNGQPPPNGNQDQPPPEPQPPAPVPQGRMRGAFSR